MIIPKRDAKYYGAVHIDNYLTFTGFCKKVDSEEICDVDVFVDGKKIDTLKADKRIGKVEDIYDIEGHGFKFELSDEYFEKSHLLEFKASTGEELVNSKIQTIDKNHPKFNEYRFLHSLNNVDVEKIKDLHSPNAIGFLATEENLNDKDFVTYINELMVSFPDVEFKAFYFNEKKKNLETLFYNNLEVLKIVNINDILNCISIYLCNGSIKKDFLIYQKLKFFVYAIYVNIDYLKKTFSTKSIDEINNFIKKLNLQYNAKYDSTGGDTYIFLMDIFLKECDEVRQKMISTI